MDRGIGGWDHREARCGNGAVKGAEDVSGSPRDEEAKEVASAFHF